MNKTEPNWRKPRVPNLNDSLCSGITLPRERSLFDSHMICMAPFVRLTVFPEDTFFSLDAEKQGTSKWLGYRSKCNKWGRWEKKGVIYWRKSGENAFWCMKKDWRQKPVSKASTAGVIGGERWQQLFPESGLILRGTRGLGTWFRGKTFLKLFTRHCHFLI